MTFIEALAELFKYANERGIEILNQEFWIIFQIKKGNYSLELLKIAQRTNTQSQISRLHVSEWKAKLDMYDKIFKD